MNKDMSVNFIRLVDYRTREQLSRLNDKERADLFEEIFDKTPSEETWQAIFELFAFWPENEQKARYLSLAEQRLAGWDERLRFMWSHSTSLYEKEHLASVARLLKSIEIYRREEHGSTELLAIATSEYARQLTCLSIVRSEISKEAWQALVESPYLGNLQHLHVRKTVLGQDDIRHLFGSTSLTGLQCLKLIDVGLRGQWLYTAGKSLNFPELRSIDFSNNTLSDDGAFFLAQAPWLKSIQRLELRQNFITSQAMRELLCSPFCQQMNQLDLSENQVTDTEKMALRKLAEKKKIDIIL